MTSARSSISALPQKCLLCGAGENQPLAADGRTYWRCGSCALIYLDPAHRLPAVEERSRYEMHQNSPDDLAYRRFLSQLSEPLSQLLPPGARGLDYGAGPGPALPGMLAEKGFSTSSYDPFFACFAELLNECYDFVVCTEAAEHFYDPRREFETLDGLIRPGGFLGLMTLLLGKQQVFAEWWYRRDPTHVCFYSWETIRMLAQQFSWSVKFATERVVILQKGE